MKRAFATSCGSNLFLPLMEMIELRKLFKFCSNDPDKWNKRTQGIKINVWGKKVSKNYPRGASILVEIHFIKHQKTFQLSTTHHNCDHYCKQGVDTQRTCGI
jgi:hypothetical protein